LEIVAQGVSQAVQERFQLPRNPHVIHREGIDDDIRLQPQVPHFLKGILDPALPLERFVRHAGIAGCQRFPAEGKALYLKARSGSDFQRLIQQEVAVSLARAGA
jgi:hypothetical protein